MSLAPILIATRGSALALAQAHAVQAQCRRAFPDLTFEIKIIKTTGDKLQTASLANLDLPKGLFTKELESALLQGEADLAVHSLKDLPTELPPGLTLGAVSRRADVRDVLIYRAPADGKRGFDPGLRIANLPQRATVATSSTRRSAQLLALRPDLKIVPIRGNVPTRLRKLTEQAELDATVLAAAGLGRLHYQIEADSRLVPPAVNESASSDQPARLDPGALRASLLELDEMLPCVGQAAIGLEIRDKDPRMKDLCENLNDDTTRRCVTAERAFLSAMGGGCQLAVAAHAEVRDGQLRMRAVSFLQSEPRRGELSGPPDDAAALGARLAEQLGGPKPS